MDVLQKIFDAQIAEIPRMFLEQRIAKKLEEAGVQKPGKLPQQIAEHLFSGATEPFQSNEGRHDISLVFSKEDFEEIELAVANFIDTKKMPAIVEQVVNDVVATLLKSLKRKWPAEHAMQYAEQAAFAERLEYRWGKALDLTRMLLTVSREWGQAVYDRKCKDNGGHATLLDDVILRLHVRACQVTAEIITLLENGFADGAMARWRTLHEIAVVTSLISQHGTELAERYVAYQAVEAKRALDMYARCHTDLGYKPMPKRTAAKIAAGFRTVLRKYGKTFAEEYGWAAHHIGKPRVNFSMLEENVGHGAMRSHYKMASYNVHASPRGAFFKLGLLNGSSTLLGGRSNAGLTEPGSNAATSLTQISFLICDPHWTLDDIVSARTMLAIRDQIPPALARAATKLARDDRRMRGSRQGQAK
jgi:hypothetical protein